MLRDDYLQAISDAGFAKLEVLAEHTYQAANTAGDPFTGSAAEAIAGAAASITVLAVK